MTLAGYIGVVAQASGCRGNRDESLPHELLTRLPTSLPTTFYGVISCLYPVPWLYSWVHTDWPG